MPTVFPLLTIEAVYRPLPRDSQSMETKKPGVLSAPVLDSRSGRDREVVAGISWTVSPVSTLAMRRVKSAGEEGWLF